MVFGTAAVLAVVVFAANRSDGYYPCGHKRCLFERLKPFRISHCCSDAAEVAIALNQIHGEQQVFRLRHGSFATSLPELTSGITHPWPLSVIKLQTTSNDWACRVERTGYLPG